MTVQEMRISLAARLFQAYLLNQISAGRFRQEIEDVKYKSDAYITEWHTKFFIVKENDQAHSTAEGTN